MEKQRRKLEIKNRKKLQMIIRLNVVSFLRLWITRFYKEDFSMDIRLRDHFEDFFQYISLTKPKGVISWIRSLKAKLDALVVADASQVKVYDVNNNNNNNNDNGDDDDGNNNTNDNNNNNNGENSNNIKRQLSSIEFTESINFLSEVLKRAESSTDMSDFTQLELKRTAVAIQDLQLVKTKRRQYRLRWYKNCFIGKDFVDALCEKTLKMCSKRETAVLFGNYLLRCGLLSHVTDDHIFKDNQYAFYRFYSNNEIKEAIRQQALERKNTLLNVNSNESNTNIMKNFNSNNAKCPERILPVGGVTLDLFISRDVSTLFHGNDGLNAFYHISPKEIARQITLADFASFKKIEHFEWLEKRFSDKNREILAPNICTAVNRFNALTGHVTYAVLSPHTCESRARVLEHWLRIAGECHEINNFSGLYSIFCGINSTPVFRLKKTWALVNDALVEMFEVFSVLFAPQKNSMNFRNSLNSAILPAIPHVGMFLSDLTFIEDGNVTLIDDEHKDTKTKINVMKLCKVAGIIERAEEFQATEYNFYPVDGLLQYIEQFVEHERDELYDLSYVREPKKFKKKGRKQTKQLNSSSRKDNKRNNIGTIPE